MISTELPILEKLLSIRAKLSAVKRDRSSYLKVEDIMPLRLEAETEMKALSELRGGRLLDESRELNRTDDVLDEILQMVSLCFLSLGKKRELPAIYSQVVAIKHIFDRLESFGVYEEQYLKPYKVKLDEINKILNVDEKSQVLPETVMQVLKYKYRQCVRIYEHLIDTIHEVDPELIPIRDSLLRIRHQLTSICCRSEYKPSDIIPLQEKIKEIDDKRENGKFLGQNNSIPPGQAVLVGLLENLYFWSHDLVIACSEDFSPSLQSIRERLLEIKNHLERLELTHKWTLRQTDLFTYQHQLHDIVKMKKVSSKFVDQNGQAPEGQTILEFLLNRCYRMIFILLSESVPVSEALTPVYNQLTTVRQCLLAVKKTGAPCSSEELYPYQMKLTSIESLRKDGKFYDDRGHIPEGKREEKICGWFHITETHHRVSYNCILGQALCVDLLEDCYHLLACLRDAATDDDNTSSSQQQTQETLSAN
ncbi:hypothetical protein BDF20DRAFT_823456 [Mycotypha africana]|uniref:uncharacterized protein n=1 Tax=Mycotypha africana TaxID=64632 RepID=UPI002300BFC0|nr:uncharacterized protein BDF20DRAFT_823456 [Mycotypha africana]KAI8973260.1 hypothetical protein BDF20DRAFT_823456 [Mycotypha africana]